VKNIGVCFATQPAAAQSAAELKKELAETKARLEVAMKQQAVMEAKMAKTLHELQSERRQLHAKMAAMTDRWTSRELALMKTIVELRTQLVDHKRQQTKPRIDPFAPRKLNIDANIIHVWREGRIQITAGTRNGLRVGDVLDVYRIVDKKKKRLAKAEVVTVDTDHSICRVKDDPKPQSLTTGDRATSNKLPVPVFKPRRAPLLDNGKVIGIEKDGKVIVSYGSDDGILMGHRILIYRENGETGVSIGEVEVMQAKKDSAVCVPVTLNGSPQKGDRAATKPWAGSSARVH
jgi:hypothetical protein